MPVSTQRLRQGLGVPLLVGGLVFAALVALAGLLWQNQQETARAERERFQERADLAAALTQSVFTALGASSDEELRGRYRGSPDQLERALERQFARAQGLGYLALVGPAGEVLAEAGDPPERLALARAPRGGPLLSDVVGVGAESFVEYAIPFGPPERRRVLIQGVELEVLTSFLADYLARLSRVDGSGLELVDANGAVLTRQGRVAVAGDGDRIASAAPVPGTTWRLRLEADRARALAGIGAARWLPWLVLGALALAAVAALRLYVRMRASAERQREAIGALNDSRDQIRTLVEALEEGVVLYHADGRTELLNASARALVGSESGVLLGLAPGWRVVDADGQPFADGDRPVQRVLASGAPEREIVGLERPDGTRRWLSLRSRPLFRGGEPRPHAVVASCTDVTEQRELELNLRDLAQRDPLTGLWNRRRFEEDLAQQLARCRRYGERAALMLLDIDGFKLVNDTFGHLAGDEVLRAMGDALRQRLRASDSAGRFGGDEFAVLLLDADEEEAGALADAVRERVTRFSADQLGSSAGLHVSVGVTALDGSEAGVADALAAADRAMYAEKHRAERRFPADGDAFDFVPARPVQPSSLRALMTAVQARDSYTGGHSREVVTLARAVARRLGLSEQEIAEVESAALLHDLGKIAIPDAILRKPGPLNEGEQLLMRQHPVVGAQMAASIPELEHLAPAIRAEHERWDGKGYPDGLAGEQIPIASRITFVCDAFHAMTSNRPYRRALSREAALAEVEAEAGQQFCPDAARELLAVLRSCETAGPEAGAELTHPLD